MAFVVDQGDQAAGRAAPGTVPVRVRLTPWLWRPLLGRRGPAQAASPWGAVVSSCEIARGILWFGTPTRSGYRLSRRRQRALPSALRTHDGWYEERSEWAGVAVVFDRIFDKLPSPEPGHASLFHYGKETLKNWRPAEYENWFETVLDEAEIDQLEITRFHRQHAGRWIVLDVFDDRVPFVPEGHLYARAVLGGDPPFPARGRTLGPSRWFLVEAQELTAERGRPFLIDPERHHEIDPPDAI